MNYLKEILSMASKKQVVEDINTWQKEISENYEKISFQDAAKTMYAHEKNGWTFPIIAMFASFFISLNIFNLPPEFFTSENNNIFPFDFESTLMVFSSLLLIVGILIFLILIVQYYRFKIIKHFYINNNKTFLHK